MYLDGHEEAQPDFSPPSPVCLSLPAAPAVPLPFVVGGLYLFRELSHLLAPLMSRSCVTVGYLKKLHKRACVAMHYDHPWKPSSNCVEEMWREDFFRPGATPLPLHHNPLVVDAIIAAHVRACPACRVLGSLLPTCYMAQMVKFISHGWDPLIDTSARHSWLPFHRNLTSAAKFSGFVTDQMTKYESSLAVRPCAHPDPTSNMVVWSSMGVVIRSSDLDRARVATGIRVTDQASLDAANTHLFILDVPPVKPRLIVDMSGSGVNVQPMTLLFHMGCLE